MSVGTTGKGVKDFAEGLKVKDFAFALSFEVVFCLDFVVDNTFSLFFSTHHIF